MDLAQVDRGVGIRIVFFRFTHPSPTNLSQVTDLVLFPIFVSLPEWNFTFKWDHAVLQDIWFEMETSFSRIQS